MNATFLLVTLFGCPPNHCPDLRSGPFEIDEDVSAAQVENAGIGGDPAQPKACENLCDFFASAYAVQGVDTCVYVAADADEDSDAPAETSDTGVEIVGHLTCTGTGTPMCE